MPKAQRVHLTYAESGDLVIFVMPWSTLYTVPLIKVPIYFQQHFFFFAVDKIIQRKCKVSRKLCLLNKLFRPSENHNLCCSKAKFCSYFCRNIPYSTSLKTKCQFCNQLLHQSYAGLLGSKSHCVQLIYLAYRIVTTYIFVCVQF